jgi:LAGLIDADG endonuclease
MFSVGLDVDTRALVFTELHQFIITIDEWEKILLYAGNFSISSPILFIRLGKIYLISSEQSAGNFTFSKKAKAITKNTYNSYINLPKISEHVPKHNSNLNDLDFGYFLTGLIEGDGWFGLNQLHIIFSDRDISLAYLIKKRIGYGNVYKIKDKKAVRYICKNKNGIKVILSLINGKLLSNSKYDQLIKHNYPQTFNFDIFPPNHDLSLDNYWLAGFTQADGCFYISIVKSKTHKTGFSVRLEFSIKQNDAIPLKLLHNQLNLGNFSQYSSGIYCYKSTGYKTAALLINYFDTFHVFGGKYVDYLKFRKVYIKITKGLHLEDIGILKIKSIASKGSSETSTQEV